MLKTHNCGQLRVTDAGSTVELAGWVHRRRDHGNVVFVDLRDRFGITQVVFNADLSPAAHALATELHLEYVIRVTGQVMPRPDGMRNPDMPTGDIEILATHLEILNEARLPVFHINREGDVDEAVRLRYRYLDLRRPRPMQRARCLQADHRAPGNAALSDQPLELVDEAHELLDRLLMDALDADPSANGDAVAKLAHLTRVHVDVTRRILYPMVRRYGADRGEALADGAEEREDLLLALVNLLDSVEVADGERTATLRALGRELRLHSEEEEQMLDMLRSSMSDEDQVELAEGLLDARYTTRVR